MSTKVDIRRLLEIKKELYEINCLDIRDIEWVLDDIPILVTKEDIEDWRFTGLNNSNFPFDHLGFNLHEEQG